MKWSECCLEARKQLGFDDEGDKKFVPMGGDTENGKALLKRTRELHQQKRDINRIVIPRKKPTRECPWRPARPRDRLIDLREFIDYGKNQVSVSEEPSFYPGVSFKNGNTFKQIRANKMPRDLDSWAVVWAKPDALGRPGRECRHFYVGQFYSKGDRDYEKAKERARQFAIEFRKEKVREYDQATVLKDRLNYERLAAVGKLGEYRPPRNRVAARQSGCQGVTWMCTTQDWQVQMRGWDAALRKSKVIKQAHVKIEIPFGTTQEDDETIERCIEEARIKGIAIRKEWERRYRTYTVKHYAKYPKYDENGKLIEDEVEDLSTTPLSQYGTPLPELLYEELDEESDEEPPLKKQKNQ